jgi:threonylcarbamoyladenosine tRNA methylthiotransferase MtaB
MTVSFKTFGCRLNRAETAQFEAGFAAAGFARVPFGTPARVVVLHSCAITQSAENECLKLIRALKKKAPQTCLVLVGCVVEAVSAETLRELEIDLAVPRDRKDDLVSCVLRHLGVASTVPAAAAPSFSTQRASLKIQDGCDFRCSYCIVPHTRGAPFSRPFDVCLREAQTFADAGFREIVVTGCNIACYREGGRTLVDLLAALAALPGLGRLRLGSLEPGTVERDVVALMAETPQLCNFLHLPVQSGDAAVLARMRRRYTVDGLRRTLDDALSRIPNLGLGADVITGFPGESLEAFERTRAFLEAFPFSNLHVFPYSERPGTPAATFADAVPEPERKRRAAELIRLNSGKRATFAQAYVGRGVDVLIEHFDQEGRGCGWTGEYLACKISGVPLDRKRQLVTCVPYASDPRGALLAR